MSVAANPFASYRVRSSIREGKTTHVKGLQHLFKDHNAASNDTRSRDLEKVREELEATKAAMKNDIPRQAKKKLNFPDPAKIGNLSNMGILTDLGYVEDENDAKLLSWAAQSKMDCTIVSDKRIRDELYDKHVKVWCTKDIVASQRHSRERKKIELEDISNQEGNPEYLVNLIKLDDHHEHLRATIFWKTFSKSIVFDTLATAQHYRDYLISARKEPPALYTRDGNRVLNDGIMDPRPGRNLFSNVCMYECGRTIDSPNEMYFCGAATLCVLFTFSPYISNSFVFVFFRSFKITKRHGICFWCTASS